MGKSNFLHSLETKLGYLAGELAQKREELGRIERLMAAKPALEEQIEALVTVIDAGALFVQHYHPDWDVDTIDPVRAHVHKSPIKIGQSTRKALDVLRGASEPMRTLDIASEILRRDGIADPDNVIRARLTNSLSNTLKKRIGKQVQSDGEWPQHWSVIR
ncbi:MAG: hypothetical protein ACRYHC_11170 [Janthinobacterium lividum]